MKISLALFALISAVNAASSNKKSNDSDIAIDVESRVESKADEFFEFTGGVFSGPKIEDMPEPTAEDLSDEFINLTVISDWNYITIDENSADSKATIINSPSKMSIFDYFSSFLRMVIPTGENSSCASAAVALSISEGDAARICEILGCSIEDLSEFSDQICNLKDLKGNLDIGSIVDNLNLVAGIGNVRLFEMYFSKVIALFMFDPLNSESLNQIILACLKVDSVSSLFTLVNSLISIKTSINGPFLVYSAVSNGSDKCLDYVLNEKVMDEFDWLWTKEANGFDPLNKYGSTPRSATIAASILKVIEQNHSKRFEKIVKLNPEIFHQNRSLCIELAAFQDSSISLPIFDSVFSKNIKDSNLPKQVLFRAFECSNYAVIEFLIGKVECSNDILIKSIQMKSYEIFRIVFSKYVDGSKLDDLVLVTAAKSGDVRILIDLLRVSSVSLLTNALCNCIKDPAYNEYVPEIIQNVQLQSEVVAQALNYSFISKNRQFISLFLSHNSLNLKSVKNIFMQALETNDSGLIRLFLHNRDVYDLIAQSKINSVCKSMVSKKLWNSLIVLIDSGYNSTHFAKQGLLQIILTTDQVVIAKYLVDKGSSIFKSDLRVIQNDAMREFAYKYVNDQEVESALSKSRPK